MTNSEAPLLSYESENRLTGPLVGIVTPAPIGSRRGNRITAERWGALLERLGCQVQVVDRYGDEPFDVLIVLHAGRGAAAVRQFRDRFPARPIVVAITGTDLYGDQFDTDVVSASLAAADRIVVLQPRTADDVPAKFRQKVRVIFQSAEPPARVEPPRTGVFEVALIGHLRPVKDPFRAAEASRRLGPESRIRILHMGEALSPDMAERARQEMATNPRYQWLGDLPHEEALTVLSPCRLAVLTSLSEGGPAVIPEAIVAGVPVAATRVAGCVGMLGEGYPGLFEPGDTTGLARILERAERDADFYQSLRSACARLLPLFHPEAELAAWRALLREVGVGPPTAGA